MGMIEIIGIAIGLAMDAFAVAICKGLAMNQMNWKKGIIIALYFGIFQAAMPLLGYLLGISFAEILQKIDHWIAFVLLSTIGINMIKNSYSNDNEKKNNDLSVKAMLILAIATSIDALAVGITFAFINTNIIISIPIIGIITFLFSLFGVKIGNRFGDKFQNKAEIAGGIILILIGVKILLEHLEIINL